MRAGPSETLGRKVLIPFAVFACLSLFAFGTLAKTIQYWPDLNTKLQISHSCKMERHQSDELECEVPEFAEAPLLMVQRPPSPPIPADSAVVPADPFKLPVFSRPPPSQA